MKQELTKAQSPLEERVQILGVGVSPINMGSAIALTEEFLKQDRTGYVCVTGVHGIIEAQDDERFRKILNHSFLTTPDGMPTVWIGHQQGFSEMGRVYGPDYMLALCDRSQITGYRHFLYGGKEGVADELRDVLTKKFPRLNIVGTYCPPFRPLNASEEAELKATLTALKVDVLWCGLSTPKQELFMSEYTGLLPVKLMVGVGAAFDLLSGNLSEAPDWMKRRGLQWLYRLVKEPRRLWRRYLINNPRFIWLYLLERMTGPRAKTGS